MRICIVPGSFDPITTGHVDVIGRALRQYERVVVAVLRNSQKRSFFDVAERLELIRLCFPQKEVEVASFEGLLVEFARQQGACAVVRGLRALTDFEYEFQLAALNHMLDADIETVFLMTRTENMFVSSSMVREIGLLGGDYRKLVPPAIYGRVEAAFQERRERGSAT